MFILKILFVAVIMILTILSSLHSKAAFPQVIDAEEEKTKTIEDVKQCRGGLFGDKQKKVYVPDLMDAAGISKRHLNNDFYKRQGADWGTFHEHEFCAKGESQSPIDLDEDEESTDLQSSNTKEFLVKTEETSNQLYAHDNGYVLQFAPKDGRSELIIGKKIYKLVQFHFHIHAEHGLKRQDFSYYYAPVEVHFVHETESKKLAVVGIFLNINDIMKNHSSVIDDLFENIEKKSIHTLGRNIKFTFNFEELINLPANKFYAYEGSLKKTKCPEGVHWFVRKKMLSIKRKTFDKMRSYYDGNYRHTERISGRKIKLF